MTFSLENLLFEQQLTNDFENGSKEHKKFAVQVKHLMLDLTGDEDWLRVPWNELPLDGNTPEESAKLLLDGSWEPHHLLRDEPSGDTTPSI